MEELRKDVLTNKEVETVHRFRSKIREIEDRSICNKIMSR